MLGSNSGHVGGSEYLAVLHGLTAGDAPPIDLRLEKAVQQATLEAIKEGTLRSAHDCSEGGLAVALAECCFLGRDGLLGAVINTGPNSTRKDFLYFGEDQSRILVTVQAGDEPKLKAIADRYGAPLREIGQVTLEPVLDIDGELRIGVEELATGYFESIEGLVDSGSDFT